MLKGNKNLHSSIEENIIDECRKNLLIQKHILPQLKKAVDSGYYRELGVRQTSCKDYDVSQLFLEEKNYVSSDFIAKFCSIHNTEMKSLTLKTVNTEHKLGHLMTYLR